MNREALLARILAYEEGELDATEAKRFEADLRSEPELKAYYEDYLASQVLLDQLAYTEIRNQLTKIAETSSEKDLTLALRVKSLGRYRLLKIAAGLLFLVFVGLLFYANSWLTDDAIASDFYEAPNLSGLRGTTPGNQLAEAQVYYYLNEFDRAVSLLATDSSLEARQLTAHSLYAAGHYLSAISLFEELSTQTVNLELAQESTWYHCLALLQLGSSEEALRAATLISKDNDHPYLKEARQLLDVMNAKLRRLTW